MRLKEIKPGMVIHCKSLDEQKALYDELCRIGNMKTDSYTGSLDYFTDADCNYRIGNLKRETWCFTTEPATVEFSDLIIHEMSAEEALQIVKKLEFEFVREYLGLPYGKSLDGMLFDAEPRTIIDMCEQWKSDHEKKEPEIETVDICRIIEIQPGGRKRCVHEEDMDIDRDLPFEDENAEIRRILKAYCMEHDGEYIAVHEAVSRVKAVE